MTKPKKPTQPKKRKNSRAKGKAFERTVAKLLTDWWGVEFHSTPASGGLRWGKDSRVVGDIVAPAEGAYFPFSIECKKREGWNFEQLLKGTGEVTDWWKQCVRDANKVDKAPLLIFSKNRSPIYFMLSQEHYSFLGMEERNYFLTTFELDEETHCVVVGMLDDLLKIPKDKVEKKFA